MCDGRALSALGTKHGTTEAGVPCVVSDVLCSQLNVFRGYNGDAWAEAMIRIGGWEHKEDMCA